jgi:dolichol-phosphate mannosyltransferase
VLATVPFDHILSDGYSFLIEMLFRAQQRGVRVAEVPITFVERRRGESKLSLAVIAESVVTPWRLAATRSRVG